MHEEEEEEEGEQRRSECVPKVCGSKIGLGA